MREGVEAAGAVSTAVEGADPDSRVRGVGVGLLTLTPVRLPWTTGRTSGGRAERMA